MGNNPFATVYLSLPVPKPSYADVQLRESCPMCGKPNADLYKYHDGRLMCRRCLQRKEGAGK